MGQPIKFAFIPEREDSLDLDALNYTILKILVNENRIDLKIDPTNPWIQKGIFTYPEIVERILLINRTTTEELESVRQTGGRDKVATLNHLGEALNAYMHLQVVHHEIYVQNRDDLIVIA